LSVDWDRDAEANQVSPEVASTAAVVDPMSASVADEADWRQQASAMTGQPVQNREPRWTPEPINETPASVETELPVEPEPVVETVLIEEEPPAFTEEVPAASSTISAGGPLALGQALIQEGRLVEARELLTQGLDSEVLTSSQAAEARMLLGHVNDELVFSPRIYPGDPWSREYEVKPGDSLSRIVSREGLQVDWRLLQRVNALSRPESIQSGKSIKVVQGPFHAEIDKPTHRMDLYLGEGPQRVFVRSYVVGLGEMGSTPLGRFQVQRGRKLVNPTWTNPRTGEFYPADDPENPIGEYWMGLQGLDSVNSGERGFGIHGTIEPDSIGTDSSMGCVRLRDGEIDVIYEALAEGVSTIHVKP
jgi:lipoprotein-anchoring transpeptidase ErfK/SrfK